MEETGCPVFQPSQPECMILPDSIIITSCSKRTDEQVKCNIKPEEKSCHVKEKASMEVTVSGVECQAVDHTANPSNIADFHSIDKSCIQELNNKNNQSSLVVTESAEMKRTLGQENLPEISIHTHNLQIQQKDLTSSNCKTNELIPMAQKQDVPMQPQSSNDISSCRAGNICTQVQQNCVQMITSVPAHVSGHCKLVEAPCYSPCHRAVVKDTFAAFCHPQPIPAPAQLIPRPPGIEVDYMGQKLGPACLALPPLISSISETRLDSKRLTQRCSLDCNWQLGVLCQTRNQLQPAKQEVKLTKDVGTMTSCKELRDMGVQVSQTDSENSSHHVFPEVCLAKEVDTGSTKSSTQKKTKVTEVKWDAEGMTWEVYGASVDPEELGLAIQKHLELQIKETADKAVKLSQQNTITKKPDKDKSQRKKSRVFGALRHPSVCCTRSSAVMD